MRTKSIFLIVCLITGLAGSINAQNKGKALNEKTMTWFGVDFSLAKFTLVTDDPAVIVSQYMKSINTLILAEPEKYNLAMYFNKSEVASDLEIVTERNSKIDPGSLVVPDKYTVAPEEVEKLVKSYNTKGPGMGLVFVAENLNKAAQTGTYYVCFFDMATKEIIDAKPYTGKAAGFGFRNYWAGSVFNIMKTWKN